MLTLVLYAFLLTVCYIIPSDLSGLTVELMCLLFEAGLFSVEVNTVIVYCDMPAYAQCQHMSDMLPTG